MSLGGLQKVVLRLVLFVAQDALVKVLVSHVGISIFFYIWMSVDTLGTYSPYCPFPFCPACYAF